MLGIQPKNFSKIAYVIFDLVWFGVAIALMFTVAPLFEKYDWLYCNEESGGGDSACLGIAAVLRISFVLFLFHLFILLMLCPRGQCSSIYHDSCWFCKFLLVICGFVGVFWIPNKFYYGWAHFARIASGIYLVMQVGLLIITAYTANDHLVKYFEETGSWCSVVTLLGSSIILAAGTVAFLVF